MWRPRLEAGCPSPSLHEPLCGQRRRQPRSPGLLGGQRSVPGQADCPVLSLQVTAMSVRVRFLSPGDAGAVGAVGRSASFAGFSSAQSLRTA